MKISFQKSFQEKLFYKPLAVTDRTKYPSYYRLLDKTRAMKEDSSTEAKLSIGLNDKLPKFTDISSFNDSGTTSNRGKINVRDNVLINESNVVTTDSERIITSQNLGVFSDTTLSRIPGHKKKIDTSIFWNTAYHHWDWNALTRSNSDSTELVELPVENFWQERQFQTWVETKDINLDKYKFTDVGIRLDSGRDFFSKAFNDIKDTNPNIFLNAERFQKVTNFNFPGSDVAVWLPDARKMYTENYSSCVPALMLKLIKLNNATKQIFDNNFIQHRQISDYSTILNSTINIVDSLNMSPVQQQDYFDSDGIEIINLYVDSKKDYAYAGLLHLLHMYMVPNFPTESVENRKTLVCNAWNFKKSVPLKKVNVITNDPIGFNAILRGIGPEWWSVENNVLMVEEVFKMLIPHKYSCYHVDSLIFNAQLIKEIETDDFTVFKQMPLTILPSNIGIFRFFEPQTFGLFCDNVDFNNILHCQMFKVLNFEALCSVLFFNIIKTTFDIDALSDVTLYKLYVDTSNSIAKQFDGALTNDRIYNSFFGTPENFSFYLFTPGILKKYFNTYFTKNIEKLYFDGNFYSPLNVNFFSFTMIRSTQEYDFPNLFKDGINYPQSIHNGNSIITNTTSIDTVNNLFLSGNKDLTDFNYMASLSESNNTYYNVQKKERIVIYNDLSDNHIKFQMSTYRNNLHTGANTEERQLKLADGKEQFIESSVKIKSILNQTRGYSQNQNQLIRNIHDIIDTKSKELKDPKQVSNLINNLSELVKLYKNKNISSVWNRRESSLTILTSEQDDATEFKARDLIKSFGLTFNIAVVKENLLDSGSSSLKNRRRGLGLDDDDDADQYQDLSDQKAFDDQSIINNIIDKYKQPSYKGFGIQRLSKVDVKIQNENYSELCGDIVRQSQNYDLMKRDYWKRTTENKCLEQTTDELLNRLSVRHGKKVEIAREDYKQQLQQGRFRNLDHFLSFVNKYKFWCFTFSI